MTRQPPPHEAARLRFKTYSHLEGSRRLPSEYDVATSALHYYPGRGFEVAVPLGGWYARYQGESPFRIDDWELFRDPRETTYTRYTGIQSRQEAFVDGLFEFLDHSGYEQQLPADWVDELSLVIGPACYPCHGFGMLAAYIGHMAPGGRITIAAALSAADEMRRVQRFAYLTRALQRSYPSFGVGRKDAWQNAPAWQPLREALERLLCAYDWGEAFVGCNLVLEPIFDELLMKHLAHTAAGRGDLLLRELLFSLEQDCAWHRDWSRALVTLVLEQTPGARAAVETWIARWLPLARRAAEALLPHVAQDAERARAELEASHAQYLQSCAGLDCPDWRPQEVT